LNPRRTEPSESVSEMRASAQFSLQTRHSGGRALGDSAGESPRSSAALPSPLAALRRWRSADASPLANSESRGSETSKRADSALYARSIRPFNAPASAPSASPARGCAVRRCCGGGRQWPPRSALGSTMGRTRPPNPPEFRIEAVRLVREAGQPSVPATVHRLTICARVRIPRLRSPESVRRARVARPRRARARRRRGRGPRGARGTAGCRASSARAPRAAGDRGSSPPARAAARRPRRAPCPRRRRRPCTRTACS
jgi:hypothetical protein